MSGSKDSERMDWYDILGCETTATTEEIQKAARKLALKFHPDKSKGLTSSEMEHASKMFLLVQQAKEFLTDEVKRRLFDDKLQALKKRSQYDQERNKTMDANRKRLREEFERNLNAANKTSIGKTSDVSATDKQQTAEKKTDLYGDLKDKSKDKFMASMAKMQEMENTQTEHHKQYSKDFISSKNEHLKARQSSEIKVRWRKSLAVSHSDDSLYQIFKRFGAISDITLSKDKGNAATIKFEDSVCAQNCVDFHINSDDFKISLAGASHSSSTPSVYNYKYNQTAAPASPVVSELSHDSKIAENKDSLSNFPGFPVGFKFPTAVSSLAELIDRENSLFEKLGVA